MNTSQGNTAGGRGKHSVYKLYIGWQHFTSGKYRVVTLKKGGGTRMMKYKTDEDLDVQTIIKRGAQFFFPNGKSQFGDLKDMDVSLASFSSENLEMFTDLDGNVCSFQGYLKSHGPFSSQYHLYIRTKSKQESTFIEDEKLGQGNVNKTLQVNNAIPGIIQLTFKRKVIARYSNEQSSISCCSMKKCYDLSAYHETPYDEYNCLLDEFVVTKIEKNDKIYLTELDDMSLQINMYTFTQSSDIILYGPDEIFGINDGDLMLGLITELHNKGILYRWFKDGDVILEGLNTSVFKVSTPGEYSVGIYFNGQMYMYGKQCIVSERSTTELTEKLSTLSGQARKIPVPLGNRGQSVESDIELFWLHRVI